MCCFDGFTIDIDQPPIFFASDKFAEPRQQRDFIFLEQTFYPAGELIDDIVFPLDHCRNVDLDTAGTDSVHAKGVVGLLK